jgi:hypothetical protein
MRRDAALTRIRSSATSLPGACATAPLSSDGGYDAVRSYARRSSEERGQSTAAAYVPHEVVLFNGVAVIVRPPMSFDCRLPLAYAQAEGWQTRLLDMDEEQRCAARAALLDEGSLL